MKRQAQMPQLFGVGLVSFPFVGGDHALAFNLGRSVGLDETSLMITVHTRWGLSHEKSSSAYGYYDCHLDAHSYCNMSGSGFQEYDDERQGNCSIYGKNR